MNEFVMAVVALLIITVLGMWICQPIIWLCKLSSGEYNTRRECITEGIFYLFVPIAPYLLMLYKKIMELPVHDWRDQSL